jgi:hypothetical protein
VRLLSQLHASGLLPEVWMPDADSQALIAEAKVKTDKGDAAVRCHVG